MLETQDRYLYMAIPLPWSQRARNICRKPCYWINQSMKDEGKDHAVRILDEGNYSGLSTHESDIH